MLRFHSHGARRLAPTFLTLLAALSLGASLALAAGTPQFDSEASPNAIDSAEKDSNHIPVHLLLPVDEQRAQSLCRLLPLRLLSSNSNFTYSKVNTTQDDQTPGLFSQFYPAGSNPSLELLASTYPIGFIPNGIDIAPILTGVGPDVDITKDFGYGRSGTNDYAKRIANNGPLGGLPAFCRFGARVVTSKFTEVVTEVWLPIADETVYPSDGVHHQYLQTYPAVKESDSLAPLNDTDYPTASTPIVIKVADDSSGKFLRSDWKSSYGKDAIYNQSDLTTRFTYEKGPPWVLANNANATYPPAAPAPAPPTQRRMVKKRCEDPPKEPEKPAEHKHKHHHKQQQQGPPAPKHHHKHKHHHHHHHHHHQQQQGQNGNNQNHHGSHAGQVRTVSTQQVLTGEEVYGNGDSIGWNGRLLFIANGGQRGFVPLADLKSQSEWSGHHARPGEI